MSEEEQREFLKGLFVKAVESRETGSAEALWDYLQEWEDRATAVQDARSRSFALGKMPWTTLSVPLNRAKFALITTGGVYVEGLQEPYETDGPEGQGDWSYREIRKDTPRDQLQVSHLHYDLSGPREDINCIFPLDRFVDMEREGAIGQLADVNYSFMGYIQPWERLLEETAPEVAGRLKEDGVDAVLISST